MEFITFKELLERELEKLFKDLTKRKTPIEKLDVDLMAWMDYYFSKKLPGILHKNIMDAFSKDPAITDIFFSESNKFMINEYRDYRVTNLRNRLFSSLFVTLIPTREMKPSEIDLFGNLITSLNSNMTMLVSMYKKIEAEYKAGTLVITPIQTEKKKVTSDENKEDISTASNKLKVNLSVNDLTTLFRLLDEINPNIFNYKSKTELIRFITNNFITKATDNLSESSVSSKFYNLEDSSLYKWERYFSDMQDVSKKLREKISK
jgi:hypothetical protein